MKLYPAIDLKDGACVRLLRGEMQDATVFNDDPSAQARAFEDAGAKWLHLVDLNGAFEGQPVNGSAVEGILEALSIPVQLGGGIRDMKTVETWLTKGVARVILGTAAVKDPGFVRAAAEAFPEQIAVGIDARGGMVATDGWAETSEINAVDLAAGYQDAGVAAIIYTDIERDGAMAGPNIQATSALAQAISIPVIASGGISSMADLAALKNCPAQLDGAISGRAIYEGKIDVTDAVALLEA